MSLCKLQVCFHLCCRSALCGVSHAASVVLVTIYVYLNTFFGTELSFISLSFLLCAAPISIEPRGLKGNLGDLLRCKNKHIPCKRQANNKNTITMRTSDSAEKWLTAPVMDFWVLDIHVEGEWIKGGKQKAAKWVYLQKKMCQALQFEGKFWHCELIVENGDRHFCICKGW